jgi:GST-like protein
MEVQRLCDVLDKQLQGKTYLVNEEFTLADIMVFPWFQYLFHGYRHSCGVAARDFLSTDKYTNLVAWKDRIMKRPAVQRALQVCTWDYVGKPWLKEEEIKKS